MGKVLNMSMTVGINAIIPQTCGVGYLGLFRDKENIDSEDSRRLANIIPAGGAGWAIASFTDNPAHLEDYEKAERMLGKKYKIVYSSPKRKNKRTGHMFWFHIYDTSSEPEKRKLKA